MLTKEQAKEKLKQLVKEFSEGQKYWDSKPEEDIKHQFIEPLFEEILGWDRKEVSKESRVLKGRADYILKLGNREVLVIEAKKTNVALLEEEGKQAVSYAYHRKIKFAVLTNFKDIRVYHALSNIKNIDKNLLRKDNNYFKLNFSEFVDKFDLLWLLSRESFEKGEINKLLSEKDEKVNKPIDETILEDLLKIREWLSKELKSKKNYLEQKTIDEVVQILIDRLIFMRSVEDRGLEPLNFLKSLEADVRNQITNLQLFPYLLQKFALFNGRYDSRLFEVGLLEKEGSFSDDVLRKVILALYFGSENNQERYLFDQIPGDLLGSIYEQYLGTILSTTEKRVKMDSASGKRKKMGIYYTPFYIVDYIVKNTVGEYIEKKNIDDILNVKILDPACGSGSFLTRAFQEVCDKIEELLKKGEKSNKWAVFKNYEHQLNLSQKITILTNCIHGVDLDEKAVELARLNILMKLLEGEGQETKKLLLPHLENNIKCGNSLIDDNKVSDRAFKWQVEFKDIFNSGGFDVVVGNPPYIRNRELNKEDKDFLEQKYETAEGQYDIYQLFFEKSINILKKNSLLGFITSNKYAIANYGIKLRKFILENCLIKKIIDVSNISVFKEASTYPYILILEKSIVNDLNQIEISKIDYEKEIENPKIDLLKQKEFLNKQNYVFDINVNNNSSEIIKKLLNNSKRLGDIAIIKETVHTGNVREKLILTKKKDSFSKKLLRGKDCQRYYFIWENLWIDTNKDSINKKKGEYATIPESKYFESPKLFLREIAEKITCCYDSEGFYSLNKAYVVNMKENILNPFCLLGLLNSKILSWFFRISFESAHVRGGYLQFKKQYTSQIPIKLPSPNQEKKITELVNQMLSLQKKYHEEKIIGGEKDKLEQQIRNIDYEIDQEVYKLYGITAEEQKIIEESLNPPAK